VISAATGKKGHRPKSRDETPGEGRELSKSMNARRGEETTWTLGESGSKSGYTQSLAPCQ